MGAIPARPPVAARAAGEAAGLNGNENSMDLNVPKPDPAATSHQQLESSESSGVPSSYGGTGVLSPY